MIEADDLRAQIIRDLLEIVEDVDQLAEEEVQTGSDRLDGARFGLNENQFNILPDVNGSVFFFRQVTNTVSVKLAKGSTARLEISDKDAGETLMCLNSCEGTTITIIQN